ncbi:MAG: hypothetical protein LC098_10175 [Burkholderiales bacterium]|nr:hypothetical protein [Burkholderiales bacterium]
MVDENRPNRVQADCTKATQMIIGIGIFICDTPLPAICDEAPDAFFSSSTFFVAVFYAQYVCADPVRLPPVDIVGKRPATELGQLLCDSDGVCIYDDRITGPTDTGGVRGGKTPAEKAEAVVNAILQDMPCKKASETDSQYVARVFNTCVQRVLDATVYSGYTLAAAQLACSPARAAAAEAVATSTANQCSAQ